jgi:hypothetical protein
VTIIRLHHPLVGKKLDVLQEGRTALVLAHPDGAGLRLPREWTDADGCVEPRRAVAPAIGTVASVRELIHLVAALRVRPAHP